jgi:hypothetical protein
MQFTGNYADDLLFAGTIAAATALQRVLRDRHRKKMEMEEYSTGSDSEYANRWARPSCVLSDRSDGDIYFVVAG